jgi:DNA helicase HerA-like ATPase
MTTDSIYIGEAKEGPQSLLLKYANRHGLIAGATGTGKTVSLQGLVEGFSNAGVPVFIADVKGDLSGISQPGVLKPVLAERAKMIKYDWQSFACPAIYWDVFAKNGHPVRTTISEMGPLLLSRLLGLNDTQEGVLNIAFAVADAEQLMLLDLDDLRAMLTHISENAAQYSAQYGNIAAASVGAIQRNLLTLEQQGAKQLFGEPALALEDFMLVAPNGQGAVNILSAEKLMTSPAMYATFMLWLMSELFEDLPEMGDLPKPKLVFFFDEAHLLFNDAPKALVDKIEQLVRLIRSKGVGIYFITQNPADIPASVLGQLSNRIQHALRAFTPQDQKSVKAAAQTFRANPAFKTEDAITQLGVGEALVSTLDAAGTPTMVARTLIKPPSTLVGPATAGQRSQMIAQSPMTGKYDEAVNRESAFELLTRRIEQTAAQGGMLGNIWGTMTGTGGASAPAPSGGGWGNTRGQSAPRQNPAPRSTGGVGSRGGQSNTSKVVTSIATSVVRAAGTQVARTLVRGLMQSLLK